MSQISDPSFSRPSDGRSAGAFDSSLRTYPEFMPLGSESARGFVNNGIYFLGSRETGTYVGDSAVGDAAESRDDDPRGRFSMGSEDVVRGHLIPEVSPTASGSVSAGKKSSPVSGRIELQPGTPPTMSTIFGAVAAPKSVSAKTSALNQLPAPPRFVPVSGALPLRRIPEEQLGPASLGPPPARRSPGQGGASGLRSGGHFVNSSAHLKSQNPRQDNTSEEESDEESPLGDNRHMREHAKTRRKSGDSRPLARVLQEVPVLVVVLVAVMTMVLGHQLWLLKQEVDGRSGKFPTLQSSSLRSSAGPVVGTLPPSEAADASQPGSAAGTADVEVSPAAAAAAELDSETTAVDDLEASPASARGPVKRFLVRAAAVMAAVVCCGWYYTCLLDDPARIVNETVAFSCSFHLSSFLFA